MSQSDSATQSLDLHHLHSISYELPWEKDHYRIPVPDEFLEKIYMFEELRYGDYILYDCVSSFEETGWRETADGTREEVVFYGGEWGWMSRNEVLDARQTHPRTAP